MTGSNLVSSNWLAERLDAPDILPVDGSWYLPTENRNPHAEYLEKHIPGAVFFDLDSITDPSSDLPHMLPSPEDFEREVQNLGISNDQLLVVYDGSGIFSAPRVWWTFRTMGMNNVKVLNGGLPKWISEGHPVVGGESSRQAGQFSANFNRSKVVDKAYIAENLGSSDLQIADARPEARFTGEQPEPRPGLRLGHIPGSVNIPFTQIVDENGCLKSKQNLSVVFDESGLDMSKPVVTSCGSGVAASILSLAMEEIGKSDSAVYDGSWSEWGADNDLPAETGKKHSTAAT